MPRPKLTKVSSTAPNPNISKITKPATTTSPARRTPLERLRRPLNASSGSDTNSSDAPPTRSHGGQIAEMSGGLGLGDRAAPRRSRSKADATSTEELMRIAREGDYKLNESDVIGRLKRRRDEKLGLKPASNAFNNSPSGAANRGEAEDDFMPEYESTPLKLTRTRPRPSAATASAAALTNIHEASMDQENAISAPHPNSRKRKMMTASQHTIQVPRSASPPAPPVATPSGSRSKAMEIWSDTMAPPLSSSDDESASPLAKRRGHAQRSNLNKRAKTSSGATTTQPRAPTAKKAKKEAEAQTISTASLQHLLPRRRARPVRPHRRVGAQASGVDSDEEEDLPAFTIRADSADNPVVNNDSDDAEGEDEGDEKDHDFGTRRSSRRRRGAVTASKKQALAPVKAGSTSAKAAPSVSSTRLDHQKAVPRITRTYARRSQGSDKENGGADTSLSFVVDDSRTLSSDAEELSPAKGAAKKVGGMGKGRRVGADLKAAAKKFADIDRWALEFEDVSGSLGSAGGVGVEGAR